MRQLSLTDNQFGALYDIVRDAVDYIEGDLITTEDDRRIHSEMFHIKSRTSCFLLFIIIFLTFLLFYRAKVSFRLCNFFFLLFGFISCHFFEVCK